MVNFSAAIRAAAVLMLLGAGCALSQNAPAAPAEAHDPLNRDTPQSSVFSFLEACHSGNYARAWRYLNLRNLPEGERSKKGTELARQLAKVLDRDSGFDIGALSRDRNGDDKDGLPANLEVVDSFASGNQRIPLELERVNLPAAGVKVWLFSAQSVDMIPKLAVLTSESPIEKELPPVLVNTTLMDTPLWRILALILVVLALAVFSRWLSRLLIYIADRILSRYVSWMNGEALRSFISPLQLLLAATVLGAALAPIGPSPLLRLGLERFLAAVFALASAWLLCSFVDLGMTRLRTILITRHRSVSHSVLPLASRLVKLTIFLLAIMAVLNNWGFNTSTLLAGLGVGGLAIALAAQKTVENLFGGVAVISDRPVSVGDYCKFGDRSGTVEDIGLRSTRVRTIDRTLVTVPNGLFSSMTIENFARRDKMLFHITLNLRRDTSADQVRGILGSIEAKLRANKKIESGATPVRFVGVGAYSLDLEIFVYVLTMDGDEFLRVQQELLLMILDQVAAAGTALAIPTQASVNYAPLPNGNSMVGADANRAPGS